MRSEYASDVEGGRPVRMRFAVSGRMDVATYLDFVAERAAWLDLDGWAGADSDGVTVVAAGPEALVGALEMACMLGPLDALVERIVAVEEIGAPDRGFVVHRTS